MPERLTDARIDELLDLEAKATPGEWTRPEDSESIVTGLKEKRGGYMRYEAQICEMSGESDVSADELFDHYYNQDVVRDEDGEPMDLTKLSVGDRAAYNWMWDGDFIAASRNSIRSLLEEVRERRQVQPILLDACHEVCMTIAHAPVSQLPQKINAAYEKCKSAIARADKEGKNR